MSEITPIIHKAISFEQDAYDFYTNAINMVSRPHVQQVLDELAQEEIKHKERLEGLLDGDTEAIVSVQERDKIEDLKLAEYLVARPLSDDATFQDVLIVAMHREKSSHSFYSTMSEISQDGAVKDLFTFLAQEELKHKNKIEALYDEVVYQEF